ncbi:MAG TPA: prephenate dehydratase [Thermoanaerobaculia bacterium]|jgi:prephenate dehydratase|nr:prephenate dehydratase [Thermoanaerobaculia bacterium]
MSSDRIAYQGVPGAFGEEAAREFARGGGELLACPRFEDLFEAVSSGAARKGVVPIENTLAGSVHVCYDLLAKHRVAVVAETVLRISHALIAAPGVPLERVRRVFSHPMALLQCEKFFAAHPGIEAVAAENTAGAVADLIASGRRDVAAIASPRAAEVYGGALLAENLEDDPTNFTRFLLIARPEDRFAGSESASRLVKTSLLFRTENRPAALFESLAPFADRGVNLTKIESRPVRGSRFEYLFYLDAVVPAGKRADLDAAVEKLAERCAGLRRLGTYPAAETGDL